MEGEGCAPDPLVRDEGSRRKQRKVDVRINVDIAVLPGPPGFLHDPWVQVHGGCISGADIAAWPWCQCAVQIQCFWCLCSGLLVLNTWVTLGFVTWRFLFSLSNGLDIDCSARRSLALMYVRTAQLLFLLFLFQIVIRQGCRFISSLVTALGK